MCSVLRSSGRPHPQPSSRPLAPRSSCGCSVSGWLSGASLHLLHFDSFSAAFPRHSGSPCSLASRLERPSRFCRTWPSRSICSPYRSTCCCCLSLVAFVWLDFRVHLKERDKAKQLAKNVYRMVNSVHWTILNKLTKQSRTQSTRTTGHTE